MNIWCLCQQMSYVLFWIKELMKLDKAITIQSQIMMKLKPMKSPSTPPQSATREPKEKASSSLITWMDPLETFGTNSVDSIGYLDSSTTYFEINLLFIILYLNHKRITHPILHEGTWHQTFCVFNELLCVHEKYPELLIVILTQRSFVFTEW